MNNYLPIPDDILIEHITPYLTARKLKTLRLSCKAYGFHSELKKQQSPMGFKTVVGAHDIFLYDIDRLFASGKHFKKIHQTPQKNYFSHYMKHYLGYFSEIDLKELGLALDEGIESIVENGQEQQSNVMILTSKNRLLAYGDNTKGQLGFNHCLKIKRMRQVPVVLNINEKIIQLKMGFNFSVVLTSTNKILVSGQLGLMHSKKFSLIPMNLDVNETIQNIDVKGNVIFLNTSKHRLFMVDGMDELRNTIFGLQVTYYKPIPIHLGVGERLKDITCLRGLIIAVSNYGKIYFSGDGHPELKQEIVNLLKDDLRVKKIHVNQENEEKPFILLLLNNNQLYAYGRNNLCQLGAMTQEVVTPIREIFLDLGQDQIKQIHSRNSLSLIVTKQGKLIASGYNNGNKVYSEDDLLLFQEFTTILSPEPNQLGIKHLRRRYLHFIVVFLITCMQDVTIGTRSYKGALLLGILGGFIQLFIEDMIEKWCVKKLEQQVKASLYL